MQTQLTYYKTTLENHPLLVTDTIQTVEDLRLFMEHHVYAVWDFMSLAKALQHQICPSGNLWIPSKIQRRSSRLVNEIILAEESDKDPFSGGYTSHFDLYCQAMIEIGANTAPVLDFIKLVNQRGIDQALCDADIPEPSRQFMISTFSIINQGTAHEIGAAFTYGRETVIPNMFKRLSSLLNFNKLTAPRFYYYLERHIAIDGEEHGPAAITLMNELCEYDPIKKLVAEQTAIQAIKDRLQFWDQVDRAIKTRL